MPEHIEAPPTTRDDSKPKEPGWQDPSHRLVPAMVLTLLVVFGIVVVAIRFNRHASSELYELCQQEQRLVAFHQAAYLEQRLATVVSGLETLNQLIAQQGGPESAPLAKHLTEHLARHGDTLAAVGYMDTHGKLRTHINRNGPQPPADISFKRHVREVLATRNTVVSGMTVMADGQNGIAIHVPLIVDGEFTGTTMVAVDSNTLGTWLLRGEDDPHSFTILLDPADKIAYHPKIRYLHRSVYASLVTDVNGAALTANLLRDGHTGTISGPLFGDAPFVFGMAICDLYNARFLLISCTPYNVVADPVLRFSRYTSILTGLTFLVSALGFVYALYLFHTDKTAWMQQRSELRQNIRHHQDAKQEREQLIAELEVKNAELERFAYTVSHDLKSPLITIRGFLGMLKKDIADGDQERTDADMARISNATEKMQRLLDELLELSRVGRLDNPKEDIDIGEITEEVLELLAGRMQDGAVTVTVSPDLPIVYADRPRFREVMQNLLENAIKFMGDQPEPTITVGVRNDDGGDTIFVKDNGIGMDPQYADRVFQLFEQLDPNIEGTGMGLAMAKRIIEHNGGRIWAESEGPGTGATFCFTLPAEEEIISDG